jgi:hypothetical protein
MKEGFSTGARISVKQGVKKEIDCRSFGVFGIIDFK